MGGCEDSVNAGFDDPNVVSEEEESARIKSIDKKLMCAIACLEGFEFQNIEKLISHGVINARVVGATARARVLDIIAERDKYKAFFLAYKSHVASQSPNSPNADYLKTAEEFRAARVEAEKITKESS